MKKILSYLILLLIPVILFSCKIKISDSDGEDEEFLHDPQPPNGAIGVSLTPQLNWVYETNSTSIYFDVYLDTINPPNNFMGQVSSNTYNVTTPLQSNTTYYWRIRAVYEGNTYESAVWSFTTTSGGGGVPTAGLIAYYPFNGNANDESGNGHNGQTYNVSSSFDRFNNPNKAFNFNGVNSYISVAHTTALQPTSGLTISAWFYLSGLNSPGSILAKGQETMPGLYSLKYKSTAQSLEFQINLPDYSQNILSIYPSWQMNTWYNVIGTYDGIYMRIYLNGGVFYDITVVSGLLGSNYENLLIGSCYEGYYFNGKLDDIRIYNRGLNETEIQQLYNER